MDELIQCYQQTRELIQPYGLDTGLLEQAQQSLESFCVPLPVIGSFNTGKSSMLNALLDTKLLPTSISAQTAVPTEIVYGNNSAALVREERRQRIGLGELRGNLDYDGVSLIQVAYRHPFLAQIPNIKLVDLPGLDAGIAQHDRLMRGYLPESLGYLLLFSAEEPVIKESVADFLMELRLRDMPVFAVLTKKDKIPREELESTCHFLKKSLSKILGLGEIPLCVVTTRQPGGMEPVKQLLLSLQQQAGELAVRKYAGELEPLLFQYQGYLSLKISSYSLSLPELDGRLERMKGNLLRLQRDLSGEERLFTAKVNQCRSATLEQLRQDLQQAKEPLRDMLLSGQEASAYVDRMLRGRLAAGMLQSLEPAASEYLHRVIGLLESSGEGKAAAAKLRQFSHQLERRGKVSPMTEEALDQFAGTQRFFAGLEFRLRRLPKGGSGRLEEMGKLVEKWVLPGLYDVGEKAILQAVDNSSGSVRLQIQTVVEAEYESRSAALAQLGQQKRQADQQHHSDLEKLEGDYREICRILAQVERM